MILRDIPSLILERLNLKSRIAMVPVGTFEQHCHLPFTTDSDIPTRIAELCEKRNPDKVILCPAITFGHSTHHVSFKGTISLRKETFIALVEDVLSALERWGIKKAVFLNGHGGECFGGNTGLLTAVSSEFELKSKLRIVVINWWDLLTKKQKKELNFDFGHAGFEESCLAMAIHPEMKIKGKNNPKPVKAWFAEQDFKKTSPNGGFSDSRQSNPKIGNKILEDCTNSIEKIVRCPK